MIKRSEIPFSVVSYASPTVRTINEDQRSKKGHVFHRLTEVNPVDRRAFCNKCGDVDIEYRGPRPVCLNVYMRQKEERRHEHGLSAKQAREFTHGKSCYLCGRDKDLVVDHCHKSLKIRGVLCKRCNTGLGIFKDDIKMLKKVIDYLKNPPGK